MAKEKSRIAVLGLALLATACTRTVQAPVAYYVPIQGGKHSRLKALACFDRCAAQATCVRSCPGVEMEEDTRCDEPPRSSYSACTEHVTSVTRVDAVGIAVGVAVGVAVSVAALVGLGAVMGE